MSHASLLSLTMTLLQTVSVMIQKSIISFGPCLDETCFDALFGLPEMVQLFHLFCWYHIDAPGQVRN